MRTALIFFLVVHSLICMDELRQKKSIIPDISNIGKLSPESKESLYVLLNCLQVNDYVQSESKKSFTVIQKVYESNWLKLTLKPIEIDNSKEQAMWLLACKSEENHAEIAAISLDSHELFDEYWAYLLGTKRKKTD